MTFANISRLREIAMKILGRLVAGRDMLAFAAVAETRR
jgi:hypothetical protein